MEWVISFSRVQLKFNRSLHAVRTGSVECELRECLLLLGILLFRVISLAPTISCAIASCDSVYSFYVSRAGRSACERGVGFGVFRECSLSPLVKCFSFSYARYNSWWLNDCVAFRSNLEICFVFFLLVSKTESVRVPCVLCVRCEWNIHWVQCYSEWALLRLQTSRKKYKIYCFGDFAAAKSDWPKPKRKFEIVWIVPNKCSLAGFVIFDGLEARLIFTPPKKSMWNKLKWR